MSIPSTNAVVSRRAASKRKLKITFLVICIILMTMIVAYSEHDLSLPIYSGKVM